MNRDPIPEVDLGKILDFYGVAYRNQSGWHNILCPVHSERNPDCGVNLDAGRIKCHACGFRGDGLDLIMELEGVSLAEAIDRCEQEGYIRGDSSIHRGPPRKSRGSVSGGARNREENRRANEARLRKPGHRT